MRHLTPPQNITVYIKLPCTPLTVHIPDLSEYRAGTPGPVVNARPPTRQHLHTRLDLSPSRAQRSFRYRITDNAASGEADHSRIFFCPVHTHISVNNARCGEAASVRHSQSVSWVCPASKIFREIQIRSFVSPMIRKSVYCPGRKRGNRVIVRFIQTEVFSEFPADNKLFEKRINRFSRGSRRFTGKRNRNRRDHTKSEDTEKRPESASADGSREPSAYRTRTGMYKPVQYLQRSPFAGLTSVNDTDSPVGRMRTENFISIKTKRIYHRLFFTGNGTGVKIQRQQRPKFGPQGIRPIFFF